MNKRAISNLSTLARAASFSQSRVCTLGPATRHLRLRKGFPSNESNGRTVGTSASSLNDDRFQPATTEEEWLKLDEKVNEYPCHRTFKAIGTGGKDFAESMIEAVEKATSRRVDRRVQVIQRPSKEGKYTAVSVRSVNIESGKQVLSVFREMKESGGKRLKYII